MKSLRLLNKFSALGLAAAATFGSMYATVHAAVQQEENTAQVAVENAAEVQGAKDVVQQAPQPDGDGVAAPALAPEEVRHDRDQTIVLGAAGEFSGRLIALGGGDAPAIGYTVKVLQGGEVKGTAVTNEEGKFEITGVTPGVGGLLAFNADGLLILGCRFAGPEGDVVAQEAELDLNSAVVMNADVTLARQMIASALSQYGSGELRFTEEASAEDDQFKFGQGEKSTSLFAQPVKLENDGSLKGEVNILDERTGRHREIKNMTVSFLRDGQVVHSAEVNHNGEFSATGLLPGLYSVIGAGSDGVFAIGVEVLGSTQEATKPGDAVPVSLLAGGGLSIGAMGLSNLNPDDVSELTDSTINPDNSSLAGSVPPGSAPAGNMAGPGSGLGGPGGGGGAGVGGGGGLGALIGAGIAGAIGYAVGKDDKPASPGT
ncbi:MAG: hypothetical protein ACK58L_19345 [Planctomycetota bacterium]